MLSLYRLAVDAFICTTQSSVAPASLKQSVEETDELPLVRHLGYSRLRCHKKFLLAQALLKP
jgi:hypothetical protein